MGKQLYVVEGVDTTDPLMAIFGGIRSVQYAETEDAAKLNFVDHHENGDGEQEGYGSWEATNVLDWTEDIASEATANGVTQAWDGESRTYVNIADLT